MTIIGVIVVLGPVQNVIKVKNNLGLNWAKLSSHATVTGLYLLACLLTFLYTCLYRILNCPVTTVNSNRPKSHSRCPLDFH